MASDRYFRILIPAAGLSQRFRDAGYNIPKPWLTLRHEHWGVGTMLEKIGEGLTLLQRGFENFDVLVGCPPGYISPVGFTVPIVKTQGQADTIKQLCEYGHNGDDHRVVVLNSDVLVNSDKIRQLLDAVDHLHSMALLVHMSNDPQLSYVDKIPQPSRYEEKNPISSYGITGAWAFRSKGGLHFSLEAAMKNKEKNEVYLSAALGHFQWPYAIDAGGFVDLGTPEAVALHGYTIDKE